MYSYFYGQVVAVNKRSITFESYGKGYLINVANPNEFTVGNKMKIYIYDQYTTNNKNAFLKDYYGFITYGHKELFLSLMRCNGIGPKTALNICKNDLNLIKELIANKDQEQLSQCQAINLKMAANIIETLSEHYKNINTNPGANNAIIELISALKNLGYSKEDIQYAIDQIKANLNTELEISSLISEAIKLIINRNTISNQIIHDSH